MVARVLVAPLCKVTDEMRVRRWHCARCAVVVVGGGDIVVGIVVVVLALSRRHLSVRSSQDRLQQFYSECKKEKRNGKKTKNLRRAKVGRRHFRT